MADVLALDKLNIANMDYLQLATFNDFSEGTMFEPTLETGFSYLHQVQQFTGVPYGEAELELVHQLYLARVKYTDDPAAQLLLDQVSANLAALKIDDARALLGTVPEPGTFALAGLGLLGLGRYVQRLGVGRSLEPAE